jgi:phage gp29-like protein
MPSDLKQLRKLSGSDVIKKDGFNDRTLSLPKLITPEEVRRRLGSAQVGDLGPLQEVYLLMDTDSRYSGIVNSLYASVIACPIKVTPSEKKNRDSKRAYELAQQMFGVHRLTKAAVAMTLAKTYVRGVGIYEVNWDVMRGTDGKKYIFPTNLRIVPPTRYLMNVEYQSDHYGELMIASNDKPEGHTLDEYPYGKIIALTDGTDEGFFDLAGAARRCLRWWLIKTYTELWWSQYTETYGEPGRVAYVSPGTKRAQIARIERFLKTLGRSMYAIFDNDVDLEFMSQSLGTPATYKQIIDLANAEIAVAIHGQTQTTDGGEYGSYAKAKVQLGVRLEIVQLVCQIIQAGLQELLKYFVDFNFGADFDPSLMPTIAPVVKAEEDKEKLTNVFDKITKIVAVPTSHIYESLEIPIPEDGEETIGPEDRTPDINPFADQSGDPESGTESGSEGGGGKGKGDNPGKDSSGSVPE